MQQRDQNEIKRIARPLKSLKRSQARDLIGITRRRIQQETRSQPKKPRRAGIMKRG
jgi:hypothetical protein